MSPLDAEQAAVTLRAGGVIAYPTEGVWGLGCDPCNERAVHRVLDIKQRDVAKGLILIAADVAQLRPFIDLEALPPERRDAVLNSWPGANTWIVPATAEAPRWITGEHTGIAVRVSAHADVVALCLAFGGALVSTSANPAGAPAPRLRAELDPSLLPRVDGTLAGETGGRDAPSVIRDARTGGVLRA